MLFAAAAMAAAGIGPNLMLKAAKRFQPSAAALAVQAEVDRAASGGVVKLPAGDLYFGAASLRIQSASNVTIAPAGAIGSSRLWFTIGAGVVVNESVGVVLEGLDIDYGTLSPRLQRT